MRQLRSVLIIFSLAVFIVPLAGAQTTAVPLYIKAIDQAGEKIQGVQIELVPSPDVALSNMITNEVGAVSLNLKPGSYRLTATRPGYFDFSTDIEVKPSTDPQNFIIRLKSPPSSHIKTSASAPSDTLRISVAPFHDDVTYERADLSAMPRTTITIHNYHANIDETYTGVRLADIFRPLTVPLDKELRGQALILCVVATGADGYQAVLSLAEIDPSFHPGEVIVADTRDGRPLNAAGPFRLIVTEDKRPARSVRNLISIELKTVK
jgi:hypothetical protein